MRHKKLRGQLEEPQQQNLDTTRRKDVVSDEFSLALRGRRVLREILCVLLALSLAAGDALAWQSPAGKNAERDRANWEKVRAIGPDKEVEVTTRSSDARSGTSRSHRGSLQKWQPDGLVLRLRKGGDMEIGKSLVQSVSLKEKGNRRKGALLGAAVGFGIGAAIGANIKIADREPAGGDRAAGVALVGGIRAVIGALLGRTATGSKWTTVYQVH